MMSSARFRLLLLPALAALVAACSPGATAVVRAIAIPSSDTPGSLPNSPRSAPSAPSDQERPRIALDPSDTVLQIIDANLEADPNGKQIIVVKRSGDVSAPVRILVADADPARGAYYYQSWEGVTSATDSRVLNVTLEDLVGDHQLDIVASGMNDAGQLTLDVFHPMPALRGGGLRYRPVCQIVADDIKLEEAPRPDSYADSDKNGESFPIAAYLRDTESPNVTDMVRITYTWSAAEGRYTPGPPEKVPGSQLAQGLLQKLYGSPDVGAFERFLSGSWVQIVHDDKGRRPDQYGPIIDLDARARTVSLSTGSSTEVYTWRDSVRTIYRVLVVAQNEAVPQITRTISVTVQSATSIVVSIQGSDTDETPPTQYTKIGPDIASRLLSGDRAQVNLVQMPLDGTFTGPGRLTVEFHAPTLTWSDGDRRRVGSYVAFSLEGSVILSVAYQGEPGEVDQTASWRAVLTERKQATSILRTLVLTPGILTVDGFEESAADPITLQQTAPVTKS